MPFATSVPCRRITVRGVRHGHDRQPLRLRRSGADDAECAARGVPRGRPSLTVLLPRAGRARTRRLRRRGPGTGPYRRWPAPGTTTGHPWSSRPWAWRPNHLWRTSGASSAGPGSTRRGDGVIERTLALMRCPRPPDLHGARSGAGRGRPRREALVTSPAASTSHANVRFRSVGHDPPPARPCPRAGEEAETGDACAMDLLDELESRTGPTSVTDGRRARAHRSRTPTSWSSPRWPEWSRARTSPAGRPTSSDCCRDHQPPRDRRRALRVLQHHQDACACRLSQARCPHTCRGGRGRASAGSGLSRDPRISPG